MKKQTPWWANDLDTSTSNVVKPPLRTRIPGYLAGLAAAVIVLIAAFGNATPAETRALPDGGVEKAPSLPALAATCGGIASWEVAKENGWRDNFNSFIWKQAPPLSGDFAKSPLPKDATAAVTNNEMAQVVASLWRGQTVIWYDSAIPFERLAILKRVVERFGNTVQLLPWPKERQDWWPGRSLIITAWGTSQSCSQPSYEVIRRFIEETKDLAPGRKTSPSEAGPKSVS